MAGKDSFDCYRDGSWTRCEIELVDEKPLEVFWNSERLEVIHHLGGFERELAIGHLITNGVADFADSLGVEVEADRAFVAGESVSVESAGLDGGFRIDANSLCRAAGDFEARCELRSRTRAVHAAALVSDAGFEFFVPDTARFSALKKAVGYAYLNGIDPSGVMFLFTGRITLQVVEMLVNSRVRFFASLATAMRTAIGRARDAGITIVGRLNPSGFVVFSGRERID